MNSRQVLSCPANLIFQIFWLLIVGCYLPITAQKPELIVQTGHSREIHSVTYSPDGKLIASGSADNSIKIWNTETGQEIRTLLGHSGEVDSVAFSPDSKMIISGSSDLTIKIWNVETGTEIKTLSGHTALVKTATFSPDGKQIVSGSYDNSVKIWNAETGQEIRTLQDHSILEDPTAFSPYTQHSISSVAFSPNGKQIVSGSWDHRIRLWNAETGELMRTLLGHTDVINSVTFSPDGRQILSSSWDHSIKIWNTSTGQEIKNLSDNSFANNSVIFSPDGKLIAGGGTGYIKIWNAQNGQEVKTLANTLANSTSINSVAFSPDSKKIVSSNIFGLIKIWNVETGQEIRTSLGHTSAVESVDFSPDGKKIVSGSWDNSIRIWNSEIGAESKTVLSNFSFVESVVFSADGKLIVGSNLGNRIKIWDAETGIEIRTLSGNYHGANSVAISRDGRQIVGGGSDNSLKIWDVATGRELRTLSGHINYDLSNFTSVAFSPNGNQIVSGSTDHTIKLWDVETGQLIKTTSGHSGNVNTVVFSADGKQIISGSSDYTVKIWDVATGQELKTLSGHTSDVTSVALSPDGKQIVSGSRDYTIKIWDLVSGQLVNTLSGHFSGVRSVRFSPNGKQIVSGGWDSKTKIWDAMTGKELASLIALDEKDWLVITPDGLFDGTPVAWKRLLWRFNNNTFDYAPVEAFFSEFYHPGLLKEIMEGNVPNAPRDISQLDRRQAKVELKLPKVSNLIKPLDSSLQTIQIEIEEANADNSQKLLAGEIRDIRLFRNNSLVKIWHGQTINEIIKRNKSDCSLVVGSHKSGRKVICNAEIPIVADDNQLSGYAFNRDNVKSNDSELKIAGAKSLRKSGTLYVLAIGIDQYGASNKNNEGKNYDLNFAVADVEAISREIVAQQTKLIQDSKLKQYSDVKVITLKNENSSKSNILLALRRFSKGSDRTLLPSMSQELKVELLKIKPTRPEDGLIIYYAGHGTARCSTDDKSKQNNCDRFYLIPSDGFPAEKFDNPQNRLTKLYQNSISDEELAISLETVDAGKMLMVIDACNSGAIEGEEKRRGPMNSKGLGQFSYEKGMDVLAASQSQQSALEGLKVKDTQGNIITIKHGLLTYTLLEGFMDKSANQDNDEKLTEIEWLNYAVNRVPQLQLEAMKIRSAENMSIKDEIKRNAEIMFVVGDDKNLPPEKRGLQSPRLFTRGEKEINSLIIAKR